MGKAKPDIRRTIQDGLFPGDEQKFLDIGCGDGTNTAHLVRAGKEVVGVEIDHRAAKAAKKILSDVQVVSAENVELPYPAGYFDCIIYGGVIGAFHNPLETLKKHSYYVKDNGYLIAHVPNIRYYKVIAMLFVHGVWDYMPSGILCDYYLRHFTLTNYRELFQGAGYEISEVRRNMRGSAIMRLINTILCNSTREFLTYEYYIQARKKGAAAVSVKERRKQHF